MRLFVTIHEHSPERALAAIGELPPGHDGIELRLDAFHPAQVSFEALRAATSKLLILTDRSVPPARQRMNRELLERAVSAGIDLVDIEWSEQLDPALVAAFRGHIVLSHHDYEGMTGVEAVAERMTSLRCAETKIAVTPHSFRDNQRLLELLVVHPDLTVIGMGETGLYSRIAAPFLGARLTFVASSTPGLAAPGQITLERALGIYGDQRETLRAARLFTVVGNPAGHSLSPVIHNSLFRQSNVSAAYTIFSSPSFREIASAFADGEALAPDGMSITAPFKEEAYEFAKGRNAVIEDDADSSQAVNTLVRSAEGRMLAANTDVDGFATLLAGICGANAKTAAVVGAGGTARAAVVALGRLGVRTIVYNRTIAKAERAARISSARAEGLGELRGFDGEIVIDTLPGGTEFAIPPSIFRATSTYIRAAYGSRSSNEEAARAAGAQLFDGRDLLESQARRQNQLFVAACRRDGRAESQQPMRSS